MVRAGVRYRELIAVALRYRKHRLDRFKVFKFIVIFYDNIDGAAVGIQFSNRQSRER